MQDPFVLRMIRINSMLALCALATLWSACDFNVEITDEKRSLNKIGGTTLCSSRVAKGSSGTQTIRLFMVDDNQNAPEAIDLDGIDQEPYNLKIGAFSVAKGKDADIKVYSHETGDDVTSTVKATVTLDTSKKLVVQANPRHIALKKTTDNKRVPRAVYLLIDMSDTALSQDNGALRTAVPGSWVLENFNTDSTRGDYDIFATLLVRNDTLSNKDKLFRNWTRPDDVYVTSKNKQDGFIYTTKESRDLMSEKFISTGNPVSVGLAPMYAAIRAAATQLRYHARDAGDLLYNPNLISISLSRDAALQEKSIRNELAPAGKAIKGSRWPDLEDPKTADFIPLQSIMWHKPFAPNVTNPPSQKDWDKYVDDMCSLVRGAGANAKVYFGNMFPIIRRNSREDYKENLKNQLDMAYQAIKGYTEVSVKYTLKGGVSGKRYNIAFKVQGSLLDQKSKNENSPYIYMTVQAP